jgi:plastocyanin
MRDVAAGNPPDPVRAAENSPRRIEYRAVLILTLLVLAGGPLRAAELRGRVQIKGTGSGKEAPGPAFVYAQKLDGAAGTQPGAYTMAQRAKAFVPRILVIPQGSKVTFPNQDIIFHNVFSLSAPAPFDLGLYRAGASKSRVFKQAGAYRIFCNIHPEMSGTVVVVPTSHIAQIDASGNYKLVLPEGRYRLTAWSEKSSPQSVQVSVSAGASTGPPLALDESTFGEKPHKNKFGQDYSSGPYDPLKARPPGH